MNVWQIGVVVVVSGVYAFGALFLGMPGVVAGLRVAFGHLKGGAA